jgi:1,2-diacylglycerol 3-alpha-glucosyltransferase
MTERASNPSQTEAMKNVAVIFVNCGPYHIARFDAFSRVEGVSATLIELTSGEKKYPWHPAARPHLRKLPALVDGAYEACPPRVLSRKLTDALGGLDPEVLVLSGYREPPMRAAARWARHRGKAVVMLSETTEWDQPRAWWKERMKRWWIGRHVDTCFVGGKAHRAYMEKLGVSGDRIWEGYDVVENDFFQKAASEAQAGGEAVRLKAGLPDRYFLFVGRLAPEKNVSRLLQAYGRYRASCPDGWGLVLVGDGPQRDELRRQAEAEGLEGVVWTGPKYFYELPLYYGLAECFVIPSTMEPWGLVTNEAMACGRPVLVSRICGCAPDLVRSGVNGSLFDPFDVQAIADAMRAFSDLPPSVRQGMGQASREIIAGYSPDRWGAQLHQAVVATERRGSRLKTAF